jgi:hypothetical protein
MGSPNPSSCHDDRRNPETDNLTGPDSQNPVTQKVAQMTESLTNDVAARPRRTRSRCE